MRAWGDRRRLSWAAPALVALIAAVLASSAFAGTITVTTPQDQFGSHSASCSLREAVIATNRDHDFGGCNDSAGPDTIKLPSGKYRLTRDGGGEDKAEKGDLDLTEDVRITGAGPGETAIDAKHAHDRAIEVFLHSKTVLTSLTVQHGRAPGFDDGGGLANENGDLTLKHSIVGRNSTRDAGGGGGISSLGGTLKVLHSTVTRNRAPGGAGGILVSASDVILKHSEVSHNTALDAGGIAQGNGSLTIKQSTIAGNRATFDAAAHAHRAIHGVAGGLAIGDADMTMVDSTVSRNEADGLAGGMRLFGSNATIGNSTISGNSTGGHGGGVSVGASDASLVATLNNVTVADNTADSAGGGIYQDSGAMLAYNTIIADNTAVSGGSNDCDTTGLGANYDLIEDDTGCGGFGANNVIGMDPALAGLARNGGETKSHALMPMSPAVNAANPAAPGSDETACLLNDQRGEPRPSGSVCDIGAYERHLTP